MANKTLNENSASISSLANEYDVSRKTFRKWLSPFQKKLDELSNGSESKVLNRRQIDLIRSKVGNASG